MPGDPASQGLGGMGGSQGTIRSVTIEGSSRKIGTFLDQLATPTRDFTPLAPASGPPGLLLPPSREVLGSTGCVFEGAESAWRARSYCSAAPPVLFNPRILLGVTSPASGLSCGLGWFGNFDKMSPRCLDTTCGRLCRPPSSREKGWIVFAALPPQLRC